MDKKILYRAVHFAFVGLILGFRCKAEESKFLHDAFYLLVVDDISSVSQFKGDPAITVSSLVFVIDLTDDLLNLCIFIIIHM